MVSQTLVSAYRTFLGHNLNMVQQRPRVDVHKMPARIDARLMVAMKNNCLSDPATYQCGNALV